MSRLLGTERTSEPRKAAKKTQSQLRFSNGAGDHLLEFRFQHTSQKHLKISRHCFCKNFASPPEKLITGILGITWFALLIALVISARIVSPYINHALSSAQPCVPCPKEWISYSHNCYYIGVERKSWSDSLVSCISRNCSLLHIDSEEEQVRADVRQSLLPVNAMAVQPIHVILFSQNRLSLCSLICPGIHSVDQAGLEVIEICLPLPPERWDYWCVPPPTCFVLYMSHLFTTLHSILLSYCTMFYLYFLVANIYFQGFLFYFMETILVQVLLV
ncbi:uncharacterized protein LOC127679296 isoform X2 [Apodemus sylvaticus]|uniref:uncharacterized protein LOC127679296 isoform X2 n=1 Tax=Apodemus sylvaticus TaxID=10129 RepID=UPI0022436F04|nr:uncharacterized protein LOC127679296 isoform X2 [Apodemus sylvaticus]